MYLKTFERCSQSHEKKLIAGNSYIEELKRELRSINRGFNLRINDFKDKLERLEEFNKKGRTIKLSNWKRNP